MPFVIVGLVIVAFALVVCWMIARAAARVSAWNPDKAIRRLHESAYIVLVLVGAGAACAATWWLGAAVLCIGLTALVAESQEAERYWRARTVIDKHARELAIRKRQTVSVGSYGVVDESKWHQEIDHFLERVITPAVGVLDVSGPAYPRIRAAIAQAAVDAPAPPSAFSPTMAPSDYEQLVVDLLQRCGWSARRTGKTGDQGVDVVATKDGRKVVIQCKLYSSPVGNAAVQEAIAGRAWEKADAAAVVSNSPFTRAAQQLATTAGVTLLHHDELEHLRADMSRAA